ncbi:MAG: protein-L-isoaspartate O-methyltransferase [Undibacterium sp.]|nr:protein-L-isoaspartate O-methyltransferase [Undibacterium sp.]
MDIALARFNMIEQQIRPTDVSSSEVLELLNQVKREDFFTTAQQSLAFSDTSLPLKSGVFSLPPKIEARMVQEVAAKETDSVLVVGADSGYLAALLAHQARYVTVMDVLPELVHLAKNNLSKNAYTNVDVVLGDALQNQPSPTYDVIVVTGSLEALPEGLQEQLNVGGRMFVVIGAAPVMTAHLISRESELFFNTKKLFETFVPRLSQAAVASHFTL